MSSTDIEHSRQREHETCQNLSNDIYKHFELAISSTFNDTVGVAEIGAVMSKTALLTTTVFAPFTKAGLMRSPAVTRVGRLLYSDTGPLCQAVRNYFCI